MEQLNATDLMMMQYADILCTLREVLGNAAKELVQMQSFGELNDEQQAYWNHKFGKETVVSAAVKLTSIIQKIMPMERKIMEALNDVGKKAIPRELKDFEKKIIERYHGRMKSAGLMSESDISYKDILGRKVKMENKDDEKERK